MFETRRRTLVVGLRLRVCFCDSLAVTLKIDSERYASRKIYLVAFTSKMGNKNSAVKPSTEQRTQWALYKKCDRSWYEEWEVELWWFLFYFRWFLFFAVVDVVLLLFCFSVYFYHQNKLEKSSLCDCFAQSRTFSLNLSNSHTSRRYKVLIRLDHREMAAFCLFYRFSRCGIAELVREIILFT